jgi:toxin ParE1/3/4
VGEAAGLVGQGAGRLPEDHFCIADRKPRGAVKVADRIEDAARDLAALHTGRRGRVSGTDEKPVTGLPYIAYAFETTSAGDEVLAIVRVIHGARD